MDSPFVGALFAFLGGAAVSSLNFAINLRILRKKPSALAGASILRQVLSIAYLAAVFLLSRSLPWGSVPLLLGAAVGLTLPAIGYAFLLARINDRRSAEQTETEEGDERDG